MFCHRLTGMLDPQILLNQPAMKAVQETMPEDVHSIFVQMIDMLRSALGDTISAIFYIGAGLLIIAFVLTLFLKEIPLRTSENKAPEHDNVKENRRKKSALQL
jgi:hypothetical protein